MTISKAGLLLISEANVTNVLNQLSPATIVSEPFAPRGVIVLACDMISDGMARVDPDTLDHAFGNSTHRYS